MKISLQITLYIMSIRLFVSFLDFLKKGMLMPLSIFIQYTNKLKIISTY